MGATSHVKNRATLKVTSARAKLVQARCRVASSTSATTRIGMPAMTNTARNLLGEFAGH